VGVQPGHSEPAADLARLAVLDAIVAGIDRRHEVVDAAYQAANHSELIAKLQDLFAIDRSAAIAIADLQMSRLTAEIRERIDQERASVRSRIETRLGQPPTGSSS
jgi:DNA gyrase/topoisomerase IV subunit A